MQALEDLDYLAALDDDGDLSDLGVILSEFPLAPELAKALLLPCELTVWMRCSPWPPCSLV